MKKVMITLLCLSVSAAGLKAQEKKTTVTTTTTTTQTAVAPAPPTVDPKAGKFKFDEETHDFKEVMEGPLAEYDFEFKNVGKNPIVITEAHGSCGCTVPKWPTEPILPKHKGVIHVSYNTTGRVGQINKDVIITSNAQQNPMKLHITGTVKPKPVENKPAAPVPPPPPPPPPVAK